MGAKTNKKVFSFFFLKKKAHKAFEMLKVF